MPWPSLLLHLNPAGHSGILELSPQPSTKHQIRERFWKNSVYASSTVPVEFSEALLEACGHPKLYQDTCVFYIMCILCQTSTVSSSAYSYCNMTRTVALTTVKAAQFIKLYSTLHYNVWCVCMLLQTYKIMLFNGLRLSSAYVI